MPEIRTIGATAYFRVAEAHLALGQASRARENVLMALDVAPGFRPAQRLLLELARNEDKLN